MFSKKSVITSTLAFLLLAGTTQSFSMEEKSKLNVDLLLRTANLQRLIGDKSPLNLMAQFKDPDASTNNVSDFDNFVALGVLEVEGITVMTEFDKRQNILQQKTIDSPWLGVAKYKQREIPWLPLQDGLNRVKACMAKQGEVLPEKISRAIIYKTIYQPKMIYDYLFRDPNLRPGVCQEVLYLPDTDQCEMGMRVTCRLDITQSFRPHDLKK